MLNPLSAAARRLRAAHGFSLIEVMVALVVGMVVVGALFAILEISVDQTYRDTARVQATQLGRTTMTRIIDELRTGCLVKEFTPIQANSSPTEVIFIDGVGGGYKEETATTPAASKLNVFLHKISYSATSPGTITDTEYSAPSGAWPNFKASEFTKLVSTTKIGEYITQTGSTPVFQYYSYATSSTSTSNPEAVSTLNTTALTTPLTSAEAAKAASVLVSFTAGQPVTQNNIHQFNYTVGMSDRVTLAFSAPSAETPIIAKPCE